MSIGAFAFFGYNNNAFFPDVSEATVDRTIANKTMICKTMRFEQTLGNGKIKTIQKRRIRFTCSEAKLKTKKEKKLKPAHKATQLHDISRTKNKW